MKFVFLGGFQSHKNIKNPTLTWKQKHKLKITKEKSIKSKISKKLKNNKENHKKLPKLEGSTRFLISKDSAVHAKKFAWSNGRIRNCDHFELLYTTKSSFDPILVLLVHKCIFITYLFFFSTIDGV
jgi:tRNA A37 threonylcarbamoyladenosine modification protein TsaB